MFPLALSTYERKHRHAVLNLLAVSYQVHTHLDWYATDEWLDYEAAPLRLAWKDDRLIGVMGASVPLNRSSWLRIVALHDDAPGERVITALWSALSRELLSRDVDVVALLVMNDWLADFLPIFAMQRAETIITLRRRAGDVPETPPLTLDIRAAEHEDYPEMTAVDQAAFAPPWQLSLADLRSAARTAAICTTARLGDSIIGYQLSTRHRETGHLARLAVLPQCQGQGVGGMLVGHMIRAFEGRGVNAVTVNTQLSNTQSQRVYTRYGFYRNGYDMPVWMTRL